MSISISHYDVLLRVLGGCDAVLEMAARGSRVRGETEVEIKRAARTLDAYGNEFHPPE